MIQRMKPDNTRTYRVRTQSGGWGWRSRLQTQYVHFEEFAHYAALRGLHKRLGYRTPRAAWEANPVIEGSTNPSDYRKVSA